MSKYKNILNGLLTLLKTDDGEIPYGLYTVFEGENFINPFFESARNGNIEVDDYAEYEAYVINHLKSNGLNESDIEIINTSRDHEGGFEVVIQIKDEYFKFDGSYCSYDGAYLDFDDVKQCAPQQVEVTVYKNIDESK